MASIGAATRGSRTADGAPFPAGSVVTSLAVVPGAATTAVLAATTTGLWRSHDAGCSWAAVGALTPIVAIEALAVSSGFAEDRTLYAVAAGDLLRSRDGGTSWQVVLTGSPVLTVAAAEDAAGIVIVLAGTDGDGAFRSRDGGEYWASANPGLLDLTVLALAVSPTFTADKTAFLGTTSGLYRSRNGGQAWRLLDLPLDDPAVQCLAIASSSDGDLIVLAGTEADGLLPTRDGGRTWDAAPSLAGRGVTALAIGKGDVLAAALDDGIAVSDDGGGSWRITGEGLGPILSLAWIPADGGGVLLAGLAAGGLARTEDGGSLWHLHGKEEPMTREESL